MVDYNITFYFGNYINGGVKMKTTFVDKFLLCEVLMISLLGILFEAMMIIRNENNLIFLIYFAFAFATLIIFYLNKILETLLNNKKYETK